MTALPSAAALARVRGMLLEQADFAEAGIRDYPTWDQQMQRAADLRSAVAWLDLLASGDLLSFERKLILGRLAHLLTGAEDGTPFDWDALLPALDALRAKADRLGALHEELAAMTRERDALQGKMDAMYDVLHPADEAPNAPR